MDYILLSNFQVLKLKEYFQYALSFRILVSISEWEASVNSLFKTSGTPTRHHMWKPLLIVHGKNFDFN